MKLQHEQSLAHFSDLIQSKNVKNGTNNISNENDNQSSSTAINLNRIQCLCISPNQARLAACYESSNHIVLYDLTINEEKGKFALKSGVSKSASSASSAINSRKSFVVKGMCFSPDSEKIAIGQSDCVIYVYRIGLEWSDKKTIVNKFNLASPVAGGVCWLTTGQLIYASIDGRVIDDSIDGDSDHYLIQFSLNFISFV